LNIPEVWRKYAGYLKGRGDHADINYLFEEMPGEVTDGQVFIVGGDLAGAPLR